MSGRVHDRYEPDEIDRKIIAMLRANGRARNQDIARSLALTAATVSTRIRRMEDSKAMRVVAVTDFGALGYKILLAIGIEVEGRPAEKVAQELVALDAVLAVHVTGARNIEVLVALHDIDELPPFLLKDLTKVRGICSLSAGITVEIVKFSIAQAFLSSRENVPLAMSATPELDSLDCKIIEHLERNARDSNREIADQLDVTEGTVRGRIKRLEQDNCIRLTAITNLAHAGAPKVALIGVHAVHSEIKPLCRKIAAMPEIGCVMVLLGRFDILAIGLFNAHEDVLEVANHRISTLKGVRRVEPSFAIETVKYDYRAAKIVPSRRP
jgi:DNA-binding Lrp family transcriptional regulator